MAGAAGRGRNRVASGTFRFLRAGDGATLAMPVLQQDEERDMIRTVVGAAALAVTLAACGTNSTDRTTGGAAAGAATGAGIGALGGPVGALAGAAIGGGAGAIAGATTSPQDVNLGKPIWSNPETRIPGVDNDRGGRQVAGRQSRSSVREAQQALNDRGYDAGPADGVWGARTQRAMNAFQRANNIETSRRLDSRTMQALNVGDTSRTGAGNDRNRAYMGGGMVSGGGSTAGTATTSPTAAGGTGSPAGTGASGVGNTGSTAGIGTPSTGSGSATTGSGSTTPSGSSMPAAPVR